MRNRQPEINQTDERKKRTGRLRSILEIARKMIFLLVIILFFAGTSVSMFLTDISEPIEVTYTGYRLIIRSTIELDTEEKGSFMVARSARIALLQAIEDGSVRPGSRLTIRWYRDSLFRNTIATVSCGGVVYGDYDGWRAAENSDALAFAVLDGCLILLIFALAVWSWASSRKSKPK